MQLQCDGTSTQKTKKKCNLRQVFKLGKRLECKQIAHIAYIVVDENELIEIRKILADVGRYVPAGREKFNTTTVATARTVFYYCSSVDPSAAAVTESSPSGECRCR